MSKLKKIVQPGETVKVPMMLMDSAANTVDALHKRLTDVWVAYQANQCGDTLSAVQTAQRALDDAKGGKTTPVADSGLSVDYVAGTRDAMIHDVENAWWG